MQSTPFTSLAKLLLMFTLLSLVSGCGWRLRGTMVLPPGLDVVRIVDGEDTAELSAMMRDMLEANDVTVTTSASEAQIGIILQSYEEDRRVTSVGSNTLVSEFELIARARYAILDGQGEELLAPSDTTVTRSYQFDQNNVAGKAEEERIIQREMLSDMARQIIYRLRFLVEEETP